MSAPVSSQSSHLMKTTRRGRPFVKDTHDLFATMIVSLRLEPHRSFFKTYPNSFTTDEACVNLSSLKFSQSNRSADPKDPSRIITTTTTTTFTMSRDMARGVGQHLMEAHLVENATDLSSKVFKDRGVFMLTPKGLHILERFITKNGISADHLLRVFATQPICMKLLHLERRTQDDEILITKSVIEVLFRRFVGREPNVSRLMDDELMAQYHSRPHARAPPLPPGEECDRTLGVIVRRLPPPATDKKRGDEYHFSALQAVDWMCDFTTIIGVDEAAEVLGQFARYGFISLVSDKSKVKESNVVVQVRAGGAGGGAGALMPEAEFRATDKAIYRVTKEGVQVAKWDQPRQVVDRSTLQSNRAASESVQDVRPGAANPTKSLASATDMSLARRTSVSDRLRAEFLVEGQDEKVKDSHTARLKQILEEPALRSLFREFLRANFCEENLSFWLDVQDFKRRFNTSSSAAAAPGALPTQSGQGLQAMERHQQDLISMAFVIYNTYLAPASPCELNIDHQLRGELISYMNEILEDKNADKAEILPGVGNSLHASQLQNMVFLYERIQTHIFRLMATDSVPKFVKTERFLSLMRSVFQYNEDGEEQATMPATAVDKVAQAVKPQDISRAYLTVSNAANEKHHMTGTGM
ncbi:hypothetical protein CcaverHIS002_0407140 [Cutaneotrichosporon cavernicola]|uniref:RGS domain-containing protein n=1 Tax=Cutaneotrichosporon cavernicola TaxID=279322 RepID=A0AA48L4M6_9TREE|nr:uncharacterized protein CcaverHIS019_0407160 [Cutaneotrichosporon cavernicola]BEI84110.1 hypothetical protein CcaverHIS002_0407140 [Cutaneotrichosporon cavernicola]BEI91896.1 hypothetical protein CcaverHIS019_0407160 [Cutaneotrichosporon cavernicola]BEI99667.1 hypothetical protein CcaverHIS631_0407100 [Cutaneotrichosporon cavernicola]BEJ07442.1 hypothetical protein CcaverHIS641_0407110 [Cutaneotrichosporon cavernicola]